MVKIQKVAVVWKETKLEEHNDSCKYSLFAVSAHQVSAARNEMQNLTVAQRLTSKNKSLRLE